MKSKKPVCFPFRKRNKEVSMDLSVSMSVRVYLILSKEGLSTYPILYLLWMK
jgi:hypothetical protein